MSQEAFLLAVKSAIDKKAHDLAQELSIGCVDLDDATKTAELFGSNSTAIVLEFNTLVESPIDPLYEGFLHIGTRTVGDPANYTNLYITGRVQALFPKGALIPIKDASGTVEGPVSGNLYVTGSEVLAQGYALLSGVRLLAVNFRAARTA